jgi:hypothetical protein
LFTSKAVAQNSSSNLCVQNNKTAEMGFKNADILSIDSFSLLLQCPTIEKPMDPIQISINNQSLSSIYKIFGPGDRVDITYDNTNNVNILKSIIISESKVSWQRVLGTLLYTTIALCYLIELLLLFVVKNNQNFPRIINVLCMGNDNRYSNSKTLFIFWFFILLISLISFGILRVQNSGSLLFFGGIRIPDSLLALSGITSVTLISAKAVALDQDNKGLKEKSPDGPSKIEYFFRDLLCNDKKEIDLGDFQMTIINGLLMIGYILIFIGFLQVIPLNKSASLPDIDSSLITGLGFTQATYLVKKLVSGKPATSDPVKQKEN